MVSVDHPVQTSLRPPSLHARGNLQVDQPRLAYVALDELAAGWVVRVSHSAPPSTTLRLPTHHVVCRLLRRMVRSPLAALFCARWKPSCRTWRVRVMMSVLGGLYSLVAIVGQSCCGRVACLGGKWGERNADWCGGVRSCSGQRRGRRGAPTPTPTMMPIFPLPPPRSSLGRGG